MADFPSLSLDWSNIQVLNEYGKLDLLISMYLKYKFFSFPMKAA